MRRRAVGSRVRACSDTVIGDLFAAEQAATLLALGLDQSVACRRCSRPLVARRTNAGALLGRHLAESAGLRGPPLAERMTITKPNEPYAKELLARRCLGCPVPGLAVDVAADRCPGALEELPSALVAVSRSCIHRPFVTVDAHGVEVPPVRPRWWLRAVVERKERENEKYKSQFTFPSVADASSQVSSRLDCPPNARALLPPHGQP